MHVINDVASEILNWKILIERSPAPFLVFLFSETRMGVDAPPRALLTAPMIFVYLR